MLAALLAPQSFMGPSGLLRKSQVPSSLSMQEAVVNVDATEAPTPPPPPAWATLRVGDGVLAGDMGFDPLGLASDSKKLFGYREAEIKHARLAMLAAAGWPLSEKLNGGLSEMFNQKSLLVEGGRAPSILNGGLISDVQFPPLPTLAVLGFFALYGQQELKTLGTLKCQTLYGNVHKKDLEGLGEEWPWGVAGDEDFDPLGLYGLLGNDAVGRYTMRELELNHGRVAMLAVLSYVMLESVTHVPVVQLTPFLFGKWYW